jgi:hypothetical protein
MAAAEVRVLFPAVLHQIPEGRELLLQLGRREGPLDGLARFATHQHVGEFVVAVLLGHLGQVHDPSIAEYHAIARPAFGFHDHVGLDRVDVGNDLRARGLDLLGLVPCGPVLRLVLTREPLEALVLGAILSLSESLVFSRPLFTVMKLSRISLDTFMARSAVSTKYIMLIIACRGDCLPPAMCFNR